MGRSRRSKSSGYWGGRSKTCDKGIIPNEFGNIVISRGKVFFLTKVIDRYGVWRLLFPEVTSDSIGDQEKNPVYGGTCFL